MSNKKREFRDKFKKEEPEYKKRPKHKKMDPYKRDKQSWK